jgi:hypothetical protein
LYRSGKAAAVDPRRSAPGSVPIAEDGVRDSECEGEVLMRGGTRGVAVLKQTPGGAPGASNLGKVAVDIARLEQAGLAHHAIVLAEEV